PAQEGLFRRTLACAARAAALPVFASRIRRDRDCHLGEACALRLVEVPYLDAIVGVKPNASRVAQGVRAVAVIVEDQRQPFLRAIQNLSPEAVVAVEPVIGLPSVDDPWLNFQFVSGEPLDSKSIKEPWSV